MYEYVLDGRTAKGIALLLLKVFPLLNNVMNGSGEFEWHFTFPSELFIDSLLKKYAMLLRTGCLS